MSEKRGLLKLGFVKNLVRNSKGKNCLSFLSQLIGREINLSEIDDYIESSDFQIEYTDKDGNPVKESDALVFRFKLPWNDKKGETLYAYFDRKETYSQFSGVVWGPDNNAKKKKFLELRGLGSIDQSCWEKLSALCSQSISKDTIGDFIISDKEYYNGAGYRKFSDGSTVTHEKGKFIKFGTSLFNQAGESLFGWFTKDAKGKYQGISWGTEDDFKKALKNREQFFVGHMAFESIDECNNFLEKLKVSIIDEPWEYKHKVDKKYKYPILKSYLEFELDRLFYEQDELKYQNRIIYNETKSKVLFNTNLINKFGHDLVIAGDLILVANKEIVCNLEISPSSMKLRRYGFNSAVEPMTPKFFQDINEIIFHCEWDIDQDMSKYAHIIEERVERFPEKYRGLSADELGLKLDNAIEFAKRIAQRNYKFIVPMYYPSAKRIQLLMPIYLETSYTAHPDFALVLTPHTREQLYTPETILGLDEVYQDARLIAKPEESWLNPDMIE